MLHQFHAEQISDGNKEDPANNKEGYESVVVGLLQEY